MYPVVLTGRKWRVVVALSESRPRLPRGWTLDISLIAVMAIFSLKKK